MKILNQIFLFACFGILPFYFFSYPSQPEKAIAVVQDSIATIEINFVGDLMCHSTQYNYARVNADSFDFSGVYKEVKNIFLKDDFTIGNLETVTAGRSVGYSGYPFFNAPDDFVYALKDAGFDLLITANNHALDRGSKGVERTIEKINEFGMMQTGTFNSQEDKDSIRIIERKGIKIAILAYTENTNGVAVPKGKNYLVNLINLEQIKKDIQTSRLSGADIVITHFHYGEEYKREPNTYQKQLVDSMISYGADIIIGGHPHTIQPTKYFKTNNARLDTGFIAYSLGNFISNQRWRYSDAAVILSFAITKNFNNDSVYLSDVHYLPNWVFKGETEKGREYIILPSTISVDDSSYNYLTKSDKINFSEAIEDTKEIITKYTDKINLYQPKKYEIFNIPFIY